MASVSTRNGIKTVQVVDENGKRHSVNLGRSTDAAALDFAKWLQAIVDTRKAELPLDRTILEWLKKLPDRQYDRVAKAGFAPARTPKVSEQSI